MRTLHIPAREAGDQRAETDFRQQFISLEVRAIEVQPVQRCTPERTVGQRARAWLLKGLLYAVIAVAGLVALGGLACVSFLFDSCTALMLR